MSFRGKCGCIAGSGGKVVERPTRGFGGFGSSAEYCGRLAGRQRYVEPVQGQRKSFASGFDIGLLARPTAKERLTLQRGQDCSERCNFLSREKSFGYLRDFQIVADMLDVDANVPTARERVKDDSVGVGQVKADRISVKLAREGRLAMRAVAQGQVFGPAIHVAAEDCPKHAA